MRSRVPLLVFGLTLLTVLPHVVFGALTPLSGGWSIIPAACNCPPSGSVGGGGLTTGYAGWGCVIQVAQNLVNFGVSLGVLVGVLVLAYAGFLWVLNPVSPENRSTARAILLNAVIGLVITLAAWLLINTLLTVLGTSVAKTTGVLTTGSSGSGCNQGAPDQGNVAITPPPVFNGLTGDQQKSLGLPANGNIQNGINYLDENANDKSGRQCALYVREALAAEGYTDFDVNHPADAKDYGPYLTADGFDTVPQNGYEPQAGDVVVFDAVPGHDSGHIEMYDGSQWVSDFKQNGFYVANAYKSGSYEIYRPGG